MNDLLDMPDYSRENRNPVGEVYDGNPINHGMSITETVMRETPNTVRKPQQKFKSRHFPEPFWGYDD